MIALAFALALGSPPVLKRVVVEGSGAAVLHSGTPSHERVETLRFRADSAEALKVVIEPVKELRVRGAARLVIESGLDADALLMISGSAQAGQDKRDTSLTVRLDDSASLVLTHCHIQRLRLVMNDGATARVSGRIEQLEVEGSGAAILNGPDLTVSQAHISISGSGSAVLGDVDSLTADLHSTGGVTAKSWIVLHQKRSGIGRCRHL